LLQRLCQHTSAYVSIRFDDVAVVLLQRLCHATQMSAYVSIREHT
jgi:hypothetical protein